VAGATHAVVTLSAAYGAGGSELGPRLAEALGVPFLDRAIAQSVAEKVGPSLEQAPHEAKGGALDRLLRGFSTVGTMFGADPQPEQGQRRFADASEAAIHEHVRSTGGVVLGRAGAVVLAEHPGALHVRLTGPLEARVARVAATMGLERKAAEKRVKENDAARDAYLRFFYDVGSDDLGLYHVSLDTTAITPDGCLTVICAAVKAIAPAATTSN
jgi:cytidylate kinase